MFNVELQYTCTCRKHCHLIVLYLQVYHLATPAVTVDLPAKPQDCVIILEPTHFDVVVSRCLRPNAKEFPRVHTKLGFDDLEVSICALVCFCLGMRL